MASARFDELSLTANLAGFLLAAIAVWAAGTKLPRYADVIADRTRLARAVVGGLLLGGATSLPELVTTMTASWLGNARLAVSNLMGGIAMQTAVLAVADLMLVGALTYVAPRPTLLLGGVMLTALIGLALAGMAAGEIASVAGVGLWPTMLLIAYLATLYSVQRYEADQRWIPADLPEAPRDRGDAGRDAAEAIEGIGGMQLYAAFAACAVVVLIAGVVVAATSDAIAVQTGLGASFVGATLLAIATSLPELSTTIAAVRMKAHGLAISNIFGSNALMVAMLFVADVVYRPGPIFAAIDRSTMFVTALGSVVTCLYLWGMLERRDRTVARAGLDSILVFVCYLGGLLVLYSIR